jgi:hypothetical protein
MSTAPFSQKNVGCKRVDCNGETATRLFLNELEFIHLLVGVAMTLIAETSEFL